MRKIFERLLTTTSMRAAVANSRQPLIICAGCTGTGKSDLGVAIAKRFNGEIISADSMQIYKGLDIVTNKISAAEAQGVPHHLIGCVEPHEEYNVHNFRRDTLRLIDEIRSRKRIPLIVGGTAYYVESVMYADALVDIGTDIENLEAFRAELRDRSPDELYAQLTELDADAARLVHPNNKFRVLRALEICLLSGRKKSELQAAQRTLRFADTLLFILDAESDVLRERLDGRVDKMRARGVVAELEEYHQKGVFSSKTVDFQYNEICGTHGVRQVIGLKELEAYLRLSPAGRDTSDGKQQLADGLERLKLRTRQYARKQRSWFTQRFIRRGNLREVPNIILLNTSRHFLDGVVPYALERTEEYLRAGHVTTRDSPYIFPQEHTLIDDEHYAKNANLVQYCSICNVHIHGRDVYEAHLKGRKHISLARTREKNATQNKLVV